MGQISSCCHVDEQQRGTGATYIEVPPNAPEQPSVKGPTIASEDIGGNADVNGDKGLLDARHQTISFPQSTLISTQGASSAGATELTPELQAFLRIAEADGTKIVVLLHGGKDVECLLRLRMEDRVIVISTDVKNREVPISSLKGVLSGENQLKKVEIDADLEAATCCALYLREGACIPIKFMESQHKDLFVDLLRHLLAVQKQKEQQQLKEQAQDE
ncbi:unnamed protein product [Vitrella brassicaformis CCMP3155]|uniref:ISP1 C-terminal domain-containing protein n=2 Tax=Vitrella brassicaformis TaxID=1169539 RepID=A0A0G4FN14_VITBC|nr:unnamed protein product [Vitrella brassicaformis CCMP3155]|mmetsp:Transcript_37361/g.93748  ORF Transcript_37361/g.93748 Transcript_37361/m.93748 type:complete len:217 (+) Transcript_37361:154-804(+)|eukprot:CEM15575.1 unnamed protein product [Vitrella brassicaformis CCMP3155]